MAELPEVMTRELGSAVGYDPFGGTAGTYEDNPELRWPLSTSVFDRMRKTDGQVASVRRAIRLPIQRTKWHAAGKQVDPRVKKFVEANFGLQEDENGRRRTSEQGLSFDSFLRHALIHLDVGHMPFNKYYTVVTEPDLDTGLPVSAYLNLSPRMPRTIADFITAPNGELRGIKQWVRRKIDGAGMAMVDDKIFIPSEALVLFVNDQEGADYAGQSILRSAWIDWKIKSQAIRINAIGLEREALGMPVITVPEGGSVEKAHQIGREYRGSERSHIVVPEGYTVELQGRTGAARDPLPSIKYHDESTGRGALAMFLNLGHDRGSQSLGETFLDLFTASLNAVVNYMEEVIVEQIVRDLVAINFGVDEPYPTIIADEITPDQALKPDELASLVQAGVITPDGELEDDVRRRHGYPKANVARRPKPVVAVAPDPADPATPGSPGSQTGDGKHPSTTDQPKRIAAARSTDDLKAMRQRATDLRLSIEARQAAELLVEV